MSSVAVLVSDLIRAANSTEGLTAISVQRLLDQSIRAISDLRERAKIVPISGRDSLFHVMTVAEGADRVPVHEWQHALLHAAEMLRDLSIVIDSGTYIRIVEK